MRPLKVLHYSTWGTQCGIAMYTRDLVHHLEDLGVRNEVHPIDTSGVANRSPAETRGRLEQLAHAARQFDVLHIQHEYTFFADATGKLRHSNRNFMYLLGLLDRAGVPTVVTLHSQLAGDNVWHTPRRAKVGRLLGENLRRRSSLYLQNWRVPRAMRQSPERFRAITFARKVQSMYVRGGMHPSVMRVIPLAAPELQQHRTSLDAGAAKQRLGYSRDCQLLTQFGFVFAHKGCEHSIRALELLPDNYHLAIVGGRHPSAATDPTFNRILELAQGKLAGRIRVTGFVSEEDRDLYHAASDACLLPYLIDDLTSSGAVTWALASGKPVIASTISAFQHINEEYDCMLLSPPGMVHEMAWHIRRAVESDSLRQQLARNAERYVEDHSWQRIAGRYAEEFQSLAGQRLPATPFVQHEAAHAAAA